MNNLTLTYDAAGNINSKSDSSASAYAYDTVHKHAVKTAGSWSMTYDANGNMITRAGGSISYARFRIPRAYEWASLPPYLGRFLSPDTVIQSFGGHAVHQSVCLCLE